MDQKNILVGNTWCTLSAKSFKFLSSKFFLQVSIGVKNIWLSFSGFDVDDLKNSLTFYLVFVALREIFLVIFPVHPRTKRVLLMVLVYQQTCSS